MKLHDLNDEHATAKAIGYGLFTGIAIALAGSVIGKLMAALLLSDVTI